MKPEWLPAELVLNGNNIDEDYSALFTIFNRDFIANKSPTLEGQSIEWDHRTDRTTGNGTYPYGFTHLITKSLCSGNKKMRIYDPERAKKLPWVRAILSNYKDEAVTRFVVDQAEKSKIVRKVYLWLEEHNFVVILKNTGDKKIILTAYGVEYGGKKSLERLKIRGSSF